MLLSRLAMVSYVVLGALAVAPAAAAATANFSGTVTAGGSPQVLTHPFQVSSTGSITATVTWSGSATVAATLVDPNGVRTTVKNQPSPETVSIANATTTGTYKLQVKALTGTASYTAHVVYPGTSVPTVAGQIGGGTSGHAAMYPSGLDVGPDGTIYVADTGNDQVKAYSRSGTLLWTIGTRGGRSLGHFSNPRDIAYLNGTLYVDDTGNNRVQVIPLAAQSSTPPALSSITAWSYRFGSTLGISAGVDGAGNPIILVAEDQANRIDEFTPAGTLIRQITGAGTAGALSAPRDAATNSAGRIFVADYNHDRIVEFGPVGGYLAQWGSHGSAPGQFLRPYGVAVDSSNEVYVADSDNERIQEFDLSSGTPSAPVAIYGSAGPAANQFQQLRRVAVGGPNNDVYGADLWDFKVERFAQAPSGSGTQTGAWQQTYGNVPPANGAFNEPSGITFDASGRLYVADSVNQRMQRFTGGGATYGFDMTWGARGWGNGDLSGFNWPRDLTYSPATGTVWVADTKNNRFLEFDPSTSPPAPLRHFSAPGKLFWPYGIDSTANGDLVVAETFMNRVERWTPPPDATTAAATLDWSQTTACGVAFKNPYDVADAGGTVYVADAGNKRIVELDAATGACTGQIATNLHSPRGVAVDPLTGNIWVADTSFNRLVEFDGSGNLVQTYGKSGSGPGQFNNPTHLDVHADSSGHLFLYVVDTYNDRIQILDLNEN